MSHHNLEDFTRKARRREKKKGGTKKRSALSRNLIFRALGREKFTNLQGKREPKGKTASTQLLFRHSKDTLLWSQGAGRKEKEKRKSTPFAPTEGSPPVPFSTF